MRKMIYAICFFAAVCFFTAIYYASYSYSLKNNNSDNIIVNSVDEGKETESLKTRVVNSLAEPVLVADAKCIIENYNVTSDLMTENEYTIPLEFVGMTRDNVIDYIEAYMSTLSEEEREVINYEVISFSNQELVIRKSYKTQEDETYVYWVKSVAGKLVVYKADKETVYIRTDIELESITETEQPFLEEGMYITGVQQLFSYLESCTS